MDDVVHLVEGLSVWQPHSGTLAVKQCPSLQYHQGTIGRHAHKMEEVQGSAAPHTEAWCQRCLAQW